MGVAVRNEPASAGEKSGHAELELLLAYVWRRQLAATVGRYADHPRGGDGVRSPRRAQVRRRVLQLR